MIVTSALAGRHPASELPLETIAEQMAIALANIHRLDGSGLRAEPQEPPPRPGRLSARAHEEWSRIDVSSPALTHVESWDVNYAGIGRSDITAEVLRRRLDRWVDELLH